MSETVLRHVKLWQLLNSDAEVSRGYDTFVSSLGVATAARPLASLMMTSARPEEGKTTVTFNLALTLMRAGKSILIVDADLRKPQIHQLLGLENTRGLAEVLVGSAGVQDVIRTVRVGDEGPGSSHVLSAITSGNVSSRALHALGSPKVKEAIQYVTKLYDLVLLDAPPTLAASDALLLAPMVDGIVLVLNTGEVTASDATRAKERIEESGGQLVGIAMNRFDEKRHGPGFHPYGIYYA